MKFKHLFALLVLLVPFRSEAQEKLKFKLDIPVFDYPENIDIPYNYPSMNQALEWSSALYELAFWGIDESGDLIFHPEDNATWLKKSGNNLFKYVVGVAFSKYGSELPIPLGVWAHEEYHRAVLGVRDIGSKNGNWMFSRWDGTVYGVSDETLSMLKTNDLRHLLYSYVAGVQYEIHLNERITLDDFYSGRSFPKGPLVLYNAYYVWNYFRFATGSASDSAKVLAPPHENINPLERDFTGADLNAWVYDMFKPELPYTARDQFPGGDGVNRRIGYSDLSTSEREYLNDQKQLSLLNFLNPAIFQIDRINISENFSFNFFTQYSPAYFGNSIGLFIPLEINKKGYLLNIQRYNSYASEGYGLGLGVSGLKVTDNIHTDLKLNLWNQPDSFFENSKNKGGSIGVRTNFSINDHSSAFIFIGGKTQGWMMGNPYLDESLSVRTGFSFKMLEGEK